MVEGRTTRDRLESRLERAERKNRPDIIEKLTAELETPPFPMSLMYIWQAYFRLRRRKAPGFNGLIRLEWPDIDAFLRWSSVKFVPWEVWLIEQLDDIFISVMTAEKPVIADTEQTTKQSLARISKQTSRPTAKTIRTLNDKR